MLKRLCKVMLSMFVMTQLMPFTEALECRMGEYEVDGRCCPTCHAGYRVHETCNVITKTFCMACGAKTYTPHNNGLNECLQCKVCDPESGFVTKWECSSVSNTVCGCSPGHFCAKMKDNDCERCEPHRVCAPGQYVNSRGTERSNTICEKCQAGTFSPSGNLGQCLPWTICTAQGLWEEKPGTDTRDALCSPDRNTPLRHNIISFIVVPISIIALIILVVFVTKKKTREKAGDIEGRIEASHPEKIHDAPLEAKVSVINLPMQETEQQEESAPLMERMSKSQDSGEP